MYYDILFHLYILYIYGRYTPIYDIPYVQHNTKTTIVRVVL